MLTLTQDTFNTFTNNLYKRTEIQETFDELLLILEPLKGRAIQFIEEYIHSHWNLDTYLDKDISHDVHILKNIKN